MKYINIAVIVLPRILSNTAGADSGAYGHSKLLAEEYVQQQLEDRMIFRLSEIFGCSKNEGIEKLMNNVLFKPVVFCPRGVPTDFFPLHIDNAVRKMFAFRSTAAVLPVYAGILPDQISCLYSVKDHESSDSSMMDIESYITERGVENERAHMSGPGVAA